MLPGNGIGDADKTCFTTDTQYAFQHTGLKTTDIKEYIRNPHRFNIKWEMDGQYYNLWSTDNDRTDANDDVVIKSVYDPSPVGYSLPASNAFTGFTTTGQASGNPNEFNIQGSFHKGWLLYLQPNKQGSTSFFYGCGARHNNLGKLNSISTNGYYWMANHYSIRSSRNLNFSAVNINTQDNSNRSSGFAVRSAEEKVVMVRLR